MAQTATLSAAIRQDTGKGAATAEPELIRKPKAEDEGEGEADKKA
jgi:hypothetical protein